MGDIWIRRKVRVISKGVPGCKHREVVRVSGLEKPDTHVIKVYCKICEAKTVVRITLTEEDTPRK